MGKHTAAQTEIAPRPFHELAADRIAKGRPYYLVTVAYGPHFQPYERKRTWHATAEARTKAIIKEGNAGRQVHDMGKVTARDTIAR